MRSMRFEHVIAKGGGATNRSRSFFSLLIIVGLLQCFSIYASASVSTVGRIPARENCLSLGDIVTYDDTGR